MTEYFLQNIYISIPKTPKAQHDDKHTYTDNTFNILLHSIKRTITPIIETSIARRCIAGFPEIWHTGACRGGLTLLSLAELVASSVSAALIATVCSSSPCYYYYYYYHVRQKTAPFYFCNSFVRTSSRQFWH